MILERSERGRLLFMLVIYMLCSIGDRRLSPNVLLYLMVQKLVAVPSRMEQYHKVDEYSNT